MMKTLIVRALVLVVYASRGGDVEAFPCGSYGCDNAKESVHNVHLMMGPGDLGILENGGMQLSFDDVPVNPRKTFTLTPGRNYTVTLTAPVENPILGFMFRLGSDLEVDTSKSITPGEEGKGVPPFPTVCPENVGGISHSENAKKFKVTAHVLVDAATTYNLDLTVRMIAYFFIRSVTTPSTNYVVYG
jgi:hypothetical protein